MQAHRRNIIFIDGECLVCHGLVKFVHRHDKQGIFHFSALQGEFAQKHDLITDRDKNDLHSVVLITDEQEQFRYSSAVLKIIESFGGPWKLISVLRIIPEFLRDFLYKLFARYRYNIGGKKKCEIPEGSLGAKFIA